MDNPVILSACRTPIGKFRGALSRLTAPQLGAAAIKSACERAHIATTDVDEVIMGNVLSAGIGQAPARQAALRAGLPDTVAALTINKMCGSGLKAVMLAAAAIRSGDADLVVAGGMESMSRAPHLLSRESAGLGDRVLIDSMLHDGLVCPFSGKAMGLIADELASRDGVSRSEQDEFANESHRRAIAALDRGDFRAEIVPVKAGKIVVEADEGPRRESNVAALSKLPAVFSAAGTVTAGNASMISDGASALVVASKDFAKTRGLNPIAEIIASATSGTSPEDLFIAPVIAIEKLLEQSGYTMNDIDLFELNEAFAAQMLACMNRLNLPRDRTNPLGGAIAIGHPIGSSGARVLTTLVHGLQKRGKTFGIATLCLGGGNAATLLVERRTR